MMCFSLSIFAELSATLSGEVSDLCKVSNLIFFVSYFASQSKKIKFADHFFDVCCVS